MTIEEASMFFGRDTALGKDSIVDYDSSVGNLVEKDSWKREIYQRKDKES